MSPQCDAECWWIARVLTLERDRHGRYWPPSLGASIAEALRHAPVREWLGPDGLPDHPPVYAEPEAAAIVGLVEKGWVAESVECGVPAVYARVHLADDSRGLRSLLAAAERIGKLDHLGVSLSIRVREHRVAGPGWRSVITGVGGLPAVDLVERPASRACFLRRSRA